MPTAATRVNTAKVKRRPLRFASLADLRAELSRIERAERAGKLRSIGNWTPGQVVNHLATWGSFANDGHPPELSPHWVIKAILKLRKRKFLAGPLPAGVKIPGIPGGTLGTEDVPFEAAMARYRKELDRLEASAPPKPNVIFGPLTHEEWIQLQLRHAELHLGFLVPG